jgi:hypothetical protein
MTSEYAGQPVPSVHELDELDRIAYESDTSEAALAVNAAQATYDAKVDEWAELVGKQNQMPWAERQTVSVPIRDAHIAVEEASEWLREARALHSRLVRRDELNDRVARDERAADEERKRLDSSRSRLGKLVSKAKGSK